MKLRFLALSLVLLAACNKPKPAAESEKEQVAEPAAKPTGDLVAAREIFASRCAACHGPEGMGNGPASATLNPKPRNYHDQAWQNRVTDEDIAKTIKYGGAAVGKSPIMPASPDLESKPEVVDGLVHLVRHFGQS